MREILQITFGGLNTPYLVRQYIFSFIIWILLAGVAPVSVPLVLLIAPMGLPFLYLRNKGQIDKSG